MHIPAHPAALDVDELLAACEIRRLRRSGPGGQHRNKVETAIVLKHRATGVAAEASERRSQEQNRQAAAFRLRVNLALAVRRGAPQDWVASTLWQSRCRAGRISVNAAHADFPALLAEALDFLAGCDYDVAAAAERLACSPSQLVRFLKLEPRALALLNQHRLQAGRKRLR
jgi:RF-1 domain